MPEQTELYVPLLLPRENKIVAYRDRSLLRTPTTIGEQRVTPERAAKNFVAEQFGLTAVKAITLLHHEDKLGFGVRTAIGQPFELPTKKRFLVLEHDIDEYLDGNTDELSVNMVRQAIDGMSKW